MSTKLSMLCERIIEAGWLIALIVTPLFFNVYSSRVFEPDKITLLRSISLTMVLAWIVRSLNICLDADVAWRFGRMTLSRLNPWRLFIANPLPSLALLGLMVYGVATITSVAPRLSLWGSYERLQGLYTTGAYMVVFFSIVMFLRKREQAERLLTTVIMVSLPISLYGIIQHFGTDPVPWSRDMTGRVASTMGNPIFVAAFLIMTVPLTIYRHLEAGRRISEYESVGTKAVLVIGSLLYLIFQVAAWWIGPVVGSLSAITTIGIWIIEALLLGKPIIPFVRISGYSVLLSAQLACLLLSDSRGPWLGLMAGLCFFFLLLAAARNRWRSVMCITGAGITAILLLALINLPTPLSLYARDLPYVSRMSQVLNSRTSQVRILIWQGVEQLVTADPLRTIIGYGPETMLVAYPPYYQPGLRHFTPRTALPDRSHNETFDVLVTTGLLGFAMYVLLYTTLFFWGLRYLGLMNGPLQRTAFLGLLFLGSGQANYLKYLKLWKE